MPSHDPIATPQTAPSVPRVMAPPRAKTTIDTEAMRAARRLRRAAPSACMPTPAPVPAHMATTESVVGSMSG